MLRREHLVYLTSVAHGTPRIMLEKYAKLNTFCYCAVYGTYMEHFVYLASVLYGTLGDLWKMWPYEFSLNPGPTAL